MNKHPYLDTPPPHVTHVPCAVCGASSGSWCRRNGKPLFPVHKARIKAHHEWLKKQREEGKGISQ